MSIPLSCHVRCTSGRRAYVIVGMIAGGKKEAGHWPLSNSIHRQDSCPRGRIGSEITHLIFQNVMKLAEWLPLPPPSPLLSNVLLPMPKLMLLQSTEWGAALWWSMLMSWTYSKVHQQRSTHWRTALPKPVNSAQPRFSRAKSELVRLLKKLPSRSAKCQPLTLPVPLTKAVECS